MTKTLLLADDSITIQKVIAITFAQEDVELIVADNGDSALELAKARRPDIVLADVVMPGKNGYELCQAIKSDPGLRQAPLLLLSGAFEPFDEQRARACGADGWISKPFESQAIINKVKELLAAAPPAAVAAPVTAAAPPRWEPSPAAADEMSFEALHPGEESGREDDLWGEFSLVDEEPASALAPNAAAQGDEDILELDDADILELDEADIVAEAPAAPGPETDFSRVFAPAPTLQDAGEFAEEEVVEAFEDIGPTISSGVAPEEFDDAQQDSTAKHWTEMTFVPDEAQTPELPEEEPAWTPEVAIPSAAAPAEVSAPVELAGEPPAGGQPLSFAPLAPRLDEQEVAAIVERVAREVVEKLAASLLERIAWEVVPDLAESLVREEIRRIKEQLE